MAETKREQVRREHHDAVCVCGHDESHHFHVSGKCMKYIDQHPSTTRCGCVGYRETTITERGIAPEGDQ